jgi:hypothetical protein
MRLAISINSAPAPKISAPRPESHSDWPENHTDRLPVDLDIARSGIAVLHWSHCLINDLQTGVAPGVAF